MEALRSRLGTTRARVFATLLLAMEATASGVSRAETAPPPGAAPSDAAPAPRGEAAGEARDGDQREEVRARFARGLALYDEGDYRLALIEFERAYSILPNYRMLYNIGLVHFQLGNYSRALASLERYLAEGGERVPPERRSAVEDDLATLRTRTARLTVEVNEPGAEITLDDATFGTSPVAARRIIDAGEHRLTAFKRGFQSATRTVVVAGGDAVVVQLTLASERDSRADGTPSRAPMWVAWGTTAALAVGAGTAGVLALNGRSELADLKSTRGTAMDERERVLSRTQLFAVLTDGLAVSAIISGIVATYLTFKETRPSRSSARLESVIRF